VFAPVICAGRPHARPDHVSAIASDGHLAAAYRSMMYFDRVSNCSSMDLIALHSGGLVANYANLERALAFPWDLLDERPFPKVRRFI
jgi:hypothetical protein